MGCGQLDGQIAWLSSCGKCHYCNASVRAVPKITWAIDNLSVVYDMAKQWTGLLDCTEHAQQWCI